MIESSTGFDEPAVQITGGNVDLGTEVSPGGNTMVINGTGEFIENSTSNPVSTTGDTLVRATPAIFWPTPASILLGTALGSAQLDAAANVPGTFVYSPAAGSVLPAGIHTLSVTFTPTDSTDYTDATYTVSITVNQTLTAVWTSGGSGHLWSDAANWGGTALAAGDSLQFGGSQGLNNTNDLAAGTPFNGIAFAAGAGAFLLGGNAVELKGDIVDSSSANESMNLPVILTGSQTTLNAAAGNLSIDGALSEGGGSNAVVVIGQRTVTLAGANTHSGGTVVASGTLVIASPDALAKPAQA